MIVLLGIILASLMLQHHVVENMVHTMLLECHTPFEFWDRKIYLTIILHQLKVNKMTSCKWADCIEKWQGSVTPKRGWLDTENLFFSTLLEIFSYHKAAILQLVLKDTVFYCLLK